MPARTFTQQEGTGNDRLVVMKWSILNMFWTFLIVPRSLSHVQGVARSLR